MSVMSQADQQWSREQFGNMGDGFINWVDQNPHLYKTYVTDRQAAGASTDLRYVYDLWRKPPDSAPATPTSASTSSSAGASNISDTAQVVPGTPQADNQMNIVDYAGQLATNPSLGLTKDDPSTPQNESMFMQDQIKDIDENAAGTNVNGTDPKYQMDPSGTNVTPETVQNTSTAAEVDPRTAQTYDAQQTQQNVEQNAQMTGAQGQVSNQAQIDPPQIDIDSIGTGLNPDGSMNQVGNALNQAAQQDLNTVDPKATLKGQLDILQSEFVGQNGEAKIPSWAAATARSVQKIAAFKGMTGSAATSAMSQALLEASVGVAQQDAAFFQTLTIKNLDNRQQQTINKANVLARMEEVNADARLTAAIQNSKAFLEMDMKNLDNQQQANLVNTQNRVQSILEDAKSENASRLFGAQSQNEMDQFYDQLNTNIRQFNSAQTNGMAQFNTGEVNSAKKFNAELETSREKFYQEMQYNIDMANAKWRQTVTLTESQQQFEAAATDVKNMLGLSVEQLNQLWDRSDALLDYVWKSAESEADRKNRLVLQQMANDSASNLASLQAQGQASAGIGSILGSVAGKIAGSDAFTGWLFG